MEKRDLVLLTMDKVIVHDIPKKMKDDVGIKIDYSENITKLPDYLRTFFKDKIIETINKIGFKVCFDDTLPSSAPKIIKDLLSGQHGFIDKTKKIADCLFGCQKGRNPSGILLVLSGTIKENKVIVILKLERDEGAQIEKNRKKKIITIKEVHDLMLTKKTKLYKACIFFDKIIFKCRYDGIVADAQIDKTSIVGDFFLKDFLGCKTLEDSRIETQRFFSITQEFILKVDDPIKRAKYYDHLTSYMNSNLKKINPKDFIVEYLEPDDQKIFENFLFEKKIDLDEFYKDNELILKNIKKVMIDFENGISLISVSGDVQLNNKVKMTSVKEGKTKVEFESRIKKVHS